MSWDYIERRQFVRAKLPCTITIFKPQDRIIRCHTENISAGGIRVILEERLLIPSVVTLEIHMTNEKPILCQGKIIWAFARTLKPNKASILFDTGIEFYEIKDQDRESIEGLVASITSLKDPSPR